MRKLGILLAGVMALFAQTAMADIKIGVVDVQQILAQAPQVKKMGQQLESEFKARQSELEKQQKKLQEDFAKLEKNKAVMNASERGKKEEDLRRMQRDLRLKSEDFQQDANLQQNLRMQQFIEELEKIIAQVAEAQSFDLILQRDGLPFVSNQLDITTEVIETLKK